MHPIEPLDPQALTSAVEDADIRVLLMVLVHLTGDLAWLEAPYLPRRDVKLIPDAHAGLPAEVQQCVRDAIIGLLGKGEPVEPKISDPGDDLMRRMMSVCLGENVPPEYAPVIREEMDLVSRDFAWKRRPSDGTLAKNPVLIVGAGVSGLSLAIRLARLGVPYTIVEKNEDVGGAWYNNRYPGCGVDTPNHSYSYSFSQKNRWTRYFSPREEIQDYLERIATTFDVRPNIRLKTRLTNSTWNEDRQVWLSKVESGDGVETIESAVLVSAIGQLNEPAPPSIAGIETFAGRIFHSAEWPDGLDVQDRRVAVIGTGATSMQLVPTVADRVEKIDVYQRSPQWARPIAGYSDPIGNGIQWLLKNLPFYAEWFRFNMFWRYGDGLLPFLRKDPDWPHPERSLNKVNERHRQEMIAFIKAELATRPDLVEDCIPTYPPYGKRILLDNGWYKTLLKPTVELVTNGIDHIEKDAIVTKDGTRRPTDIIVLATGFKMTEMASRLNIKGRSGLDLREAWADENPTAYLGLTVPGFPNFFCMLGPNAGLGHGGSTMFQAECQSRYVSGCVLHMIENDLASIEVKKSVHDNYIAKVDAEHEQMIWTHPGMSTYYRNSRGRVFSVMPWRLVDYWEMTHDPDMAEYLSNEAAVA